MDAVVKTDIHPFLETTATMPASLYGTGASHDFSPRFSK